jgi:FAD/FMN-containing dehydrogenase
MLRRMPSLTVTDLRRGLRAHGATGAVIRPDDPGYENARRIWNGTADRRPAAILRCTSEADVAAAIAVARANDLPLAIRGGGHSIPGHSTCDGGVVADLSPMDTVDVDPAARIARVGGGALLGQLDRATQRSGLAVTAGQVSHTGVAGLTLGGGIGWLMRKHGLTIDNLLAAHVVTAAGERVRAAADEHPELFWALRGGGGNFGVVTRFEFRLHPVGPLICAGPLLFPLGRAEEALAASRAVMAAAPEELTIFEALVTAPPQAPFPAELQGRPVLSIGVAHLGGEDAARRDLAPLRALRPALDAVGPMPYVALQSMIDDAVPHGRRYRIRGQWLRALDDHAIGAVVDAYRNATSPFNQIVMCRLGGAVARVPADATAFARRDAVHYAMGVGAWELGPGDAHAAWVDGLSDALRPSASGGGYVNELGDQPARAGYTDATWQRLVRVKQRWDPENVFRLNANIPPEG